jgi:hypothetical protein
VENLSNKQWCDKFGWGMAKVLHIILLEVTKATCSTTTFITINLHEVMMIIMHLIICGSNMEKDPHHFLCKNNWYFWKKKFSNLLKCLLELVWGWNN